MAAVRLAAVVLNYETPDDTVRVVESLEASHRRPTDVIVVDNGSSGVSVARLRALGSRVRLLSAPRNLGFSAGNNAGIREALARGAELVALVNSDATVTGACLGRLEAAIDSGAGIAGPVVVSASDSTRVLTAGIRFSLRTGRMREIGAGSRLGTAELEGCRSVDAVSGCVMLVRRDVFERIGLLDEDYFFSFEDLDFCLRARRAGIATVCAGDAVATHIGSRSIGRRSPDRHYFATRNHLLVSRRFGAPRGPGSALARAGAILALNLAHAMFRSDAPTPAAVASVFRGAWHYAAGRYGRPI